MPKIKNELTIIPNEVIANKIYIIRGHKVMIDRDLAELYGVDTRTLNQAVRRNKKRFPVDFMWQLTQDEFENWMSQIVISNREKMGLRKRPLVFYRARRGHAFRYDQYFRVVFEAIRKLIENDDKPRKPIGFN